MKYPPPEIKTLDNLVEWCAMPKAELPNHIPWCFKRFAVFTDYIDRDQDFTLLNNSKYIWYNTLAIPVMTSEWDEQAVHIVRCTASTRSTQHKPLRNDTVLLWMWTSPDTRIESCVGRILAWLECPFVVRDAESSVQGLLPLFQMFAKRVDMSDCSNSDCQGTASTSDATSARLKQLLQATFHCPNRLSHTYQSEPRSYTPSSADATAKLLAVVIDQYH